jgi:multicomponent Na+:H+ antiporter subunit C
LLSITAGALFSAGIYLVLRRSLVKILIGLIVLSYAVNLLLFNSAPLVPARPPLIPMGQVTPSGFYADPVPQALILTAIVISFGITAFAVVLVRQTYRVVGKDDLNLMHCTDIPCEENEVETELEQEEKNS